MAGRHRRVSHRRVPSRRGRHRKPPSPARLAVPTGLAGAIVAAAVITLTHGSASGSPPPRTTAPIAVNDVTPSVLGFHTSRPPTVSPTPAHHRDRPTAAHHKAHRHRPPATLRIRATSNCYVQVTTAGGRVLVRRILHRHDQLRFRRHGLGVVLGNAGGARMAIDGRAAHRAGASGQVRRFRVR